MSAAIDDDPWVRNPKPKQTPFWRWPHTWIALGCFVVVLDSVLIPASVSMDGSRADERVGIPPVSAPLTPV